MLRVSKTPRRGGGGEGFAIALDRNVQRPIIVRFDTETTWTEISEFNAVVTDVVDKVGESAAVIENAKLKVNRLCCC